MLAKNVINRYNEGKGEEMYRKAIEDLKKWKNSARRKPLVLKGARQVGKTWLLQELGRTEYEACAYVNLDHNPQMDTLFSLDMDIPRIIEGLEVASGVKIVPGKTLIILDEIQENPAALASLKYFYENAPEYHVAVAGSLLGIALHENTSFPVGKVNFLDIYPLTFAEFLRAAKKEKYAELVEQGDFTAIAPFHEALLDLLRTYMVVGGMPEAVLNYATEGNVLGVREVQREILEAYEQDFSKHAPAGLVPKIREVFEILPEQLAKENRKFIFSMVRSGARAKDYETAIMWLEDAGIVRRVKRTSSVNLPVSAYADKDSFKLFFLDCGLLSAAADVKVETVLDGSALFQNLKGALAEQFVLQELIAAGETPFYYSKEDSRGEIDFLLNGAQAVLPIEVKAGENLSSASLKAFLERFSEVPKAVKLSTLSSVEQGGILNLALYLAGRSQKASAIM